MEQWKAELIVGGAVLFAVIVAWIEARMSGDDYPRLPKDKKD